MKALSSRFAVIISVVSLLATTSPGRSVAATHKSWPPVTDAVKSCLLSNPVDDEMKIALDNHLLDEVKKLAAEKAATMDQCYQQLHHPLLELAEAHYAGIVAGVDVQTHTDLTEARTIISTMRAEVADLDQYDIPASGQDWYSRAKLGVDMLPRMLGGAGDNNMGSAASAPVSAANPVEVTAFYISPSVVQPGELDYCVDFTNVSNNTENLIRFAVVQVDAFGQPTSSGFTFDLAGSYSPGISIQHRDGTGIGMGGSRVNCFAYPAINGMSGQYATSHETIRAIKVRFDDGSVWSQ